MAVTIPALVRKLLVALVALLCAALLAELGARAWLHWLASDADFRTYASISQLRDRYGEFSRFRAHRHLGFALAPGYQRNRNRHNARGFRGAEFGVAKPEGATRIVCCGGSTTYGEGVPDDFAASYPAQLEERLRADGLTVEVINAGCPGWTTLETLVNLQTRLLDLSPDYLVVYHGINDVLPRIVWPHDAYRGDLSGWLRRDEHLTTASLLESSTLIRALLVKSGSIEPHDSLLRIIGDVPPTSHTFAFRSQRRAGSYPAGTFREVPVEAMIAANPPEFFERNLRSLVAVAEARGIRVVLTTFAFSRQFPNRPYIGHPAIQNAIEETNGVVRGLASQTPATLFDLAALLPDDAALFTDGVHFTREGNQRRADLLAEHLREHHGLGR